MVDTYSECHPGYACLTCKSKECRPPSRISSVETTEEQFMLWQSGMYGIWGGRAPHWVRSNKKHPRKKRTANKSDTPSKNQSSNEFLHFHYSIGGCDK